VAAGGLSATQMACKMIVQIPGSQVKAHLCCEGVPVVIHVAYFQANLIILGTKGLDVVLGMDWMSKYQGHIDCARKSITITNSEGIQVEHIATMPSRKAYYKKSVSRPTLDQVPVVCEYPMSSPKSCQVCPPTGILSSLLS
jgi:hypothetical protein